MNCALGQKSLGRELELTEEANIYFNILPLSP